MHKDVILIYSQRSSPRLRYSLNCLFSILPYWKYELTDNPIQFEQFQGPKINYSNRNVENDSLTIPQDDFIFEKEIRSFSPKGGTYYGIPYLFALATKANLPFDFFSFTFYMLSRYEEYLDFEADEHGRFRASQSLAFRHHFLHLPIIQVWWRHILDLLNKEHSSLHFNFKKGQLTPSVDIDMAWAYCHKGWRNGAGGIKNLLTLDFTRFRERIKVSSGLKSDPFFTFDFLEKQFATQGKEPIYFFLLRDGTTYDKAYHWKNTTFKKYFKELSSKHTVGIHPSYLSNTNPKALKEECRRFEQITDFAPLASRQHFLKLKFPNTYLNLIAENIQHDYSLGYAAQCGFRAGWAYAFPWYNLKKEETTELMLHPFIIMDVTLKQYLKYTPEQAIELVHQYKNTIKEYGGDFIFIWHNSSFASLDRWEGYEEVFNQLIMRSNK